MSSSGESQPGSKPVSRPRKRARTNASAQRDKPSTEEEQLVDAPKASPAKEAATRPEILTSAEGDSYIQIGKQKRATVRKFKNMILVDIREYYGKPGEEKPGKKGISLSLEQWRALQSVSDDLNHLIDQLS